MPESDEETEGAGIAEQRPQPGPGQRAEFRARPEC